MLLPLLKALKMKFHKWCFIYFLLFISNPSFGQFDIDLLIPYTSDTSIYALNFLERADGSFIILNNNTEFDDIPNQIPIEGPMTYGSGLIKLSNTGDILANTWFPTNSIIDDGGLFAQGRTPTKHFLVSTNQTILLPYSIYVGVLECDDNFAKISYKKSVAVIDPLSMDMINNNYFSADSICAIDDIRGIIQQSNGNYLILYQDDHLDSLIIEVIDSSLSVISTTSIIVNSPFLFFDGYSDSFIVGLSNNCQLFDFNGTLQNSFDFQEPISLSLTDLKIKTSEDHIFILSTGHTTYPDRGSSLTILDRQGDVVAQKAFPDKVLIDFDLINNNQIISLADNSSFDYYDSMPLPLNIQIFNLNLELISEKDYGQPFVHPQMIKSVSNNEFAVLGTRFKSIDLVNGKEADQVYFLKKSLADLIPVSTKLVDTEYTFLDIYPNPSYDVVNINFKNTAQKNDGTFQLVDLNGKVLLEFQIDNDLNSYVLNVERYPDGIYFLTYYRQGVVVFSEQIIVQK